MHVTSHMQVNANKREMEELQKTWEEKLAESHQANQVRRARDTYGNEKRRGRCLPDTEAEPLICGYAMCSGPVNMQTRAGKGQTGGTETPENEDDPSLLELERGPPTNGDGGASHQAGDSQDRESESHTPCRYPD